MTREELMLREREVVALEDQASSLRSIAESLSAFARKLEEENSAKKAEYRE